MFLFVLLDGSLCGFVFSVDIFFNSSSIFEKWSLVFLQLSFSFLEDSAIFTDLTFFAVVTTRETKQFSSTIWIFFQISGVGQIV